MTRASPSPPPSSRALRRSSSRRGRRRTSPRLATVVSSAYLCAAHLTAGECPSVLPADSPAQQLLASLYAWHSGSRQRRESVEHLRRLARALYLTRLGPALKGFVDLVDKESPAHGHGCLHPFCAPCPLPQHALALPGADRALDYRASSISASSIAAAPRRFGSKSASDFPQRQTDTAGRSERSGRPQAEQWSTSQHRCSRQADSE